MKKIFLSLLILPVLAFGQYQKVVAIGDSLMAGYLSGGLAETYQVNSMPALIARQLGIGDFQQPLVSEPGIPAQLELKSLSPVTVAPKSDTYGLPLNLYLPRPYDNLSVPGATLNDCLTKKADQNGMHSLVLRGLGTQVEQAIALQPDLLLVWIGANDYLWAVLMGTPFEGGPHGAETLTPKAQFHADYGQLLDALRGHTGADIVVANLPDCTSIPFSTTVPPYIINPATGLPITGRDGLPMTYLGQSDDGSPFISPGALVLLPALEYIYQGYGIPEVLGGSGEPLPTEVVLTPNETAMIRDYTASYNASIASLAAAHGIPVVDIYSELADFKAHGLHFAGIEITADFLSGGFYSYDAVHPNAFGYAVGANLFLETVNANYGADIPLVGLYQFWAGSPAGLTGAGYGTAMDPLVLRGWSNWMQLFMPDSQVMKGKTLR